MNNVIKRRIEMVERVDRFAGNSELVPKPRTTALFAQLKTKLELLRTLAGRQTLGHTDYQAASSERTRAAALLRQQLRDISAVAKGLDPEAFPGVAEKFPMPRSSAHQPLVSAAYAFIEAATPIKQTFLDQGMAADFLEQLATAVAQFHTLSGDQHGGLQEQVAGTAGLVEESRRAVRLVRELSSILRPQIRSNVSLHAAWRTASRMERAPHRDQMEDAGPGTTALRSQDGAPRRPALAVKASADGGNALLAGTPGMPPAQPRTNGSPVAA